MKILVTPTSFKPDNDSPAMQKLKAFADELIFNPYGRPMTEDELAKLLPGCSGMIAGLDFLTAEALCSADSLRVISRYGAGVDRVDITAASNHGIAVTNTPGANAKAVAELAFGLMLSVVRKIPMLDRKTKDGDWVRSSGTELGGKTLGLLGLGAIGKTVARQAQGFSMSVIAYDPYIDTAYANDNDIAIVTLDELVAQSNVISLHVPLCNETRHLINAERIAQMKDGVIIINTARGGIIDEAAACDAIASGKIGGLGLDAYEQEPPTRSKLFEFDNVVLTPHAAAHTQEAKAGMAAMAVDNLIAVLSGNDCRYIVNKTSL